MSYKSFRNTILSVEVKTQDSGTKAFTIKENVSRNFVVKVSFILVFIIIICVSGWLVDNNFENKKTEQELTLLGVAPEVVLENPEKDISVFSSTYDVGVDFEPHNGMWRAGVKINGEDVTPQNLISESYKGFDWRENVSLKMGENEFEFSYKDFDTGSINRTKTVRITRLPILAEINNLENFSPRLISNKEFFGKLIDQEEVNPEYMDAENLGNEPKIIKVYKIGDFIYENEKLPVYFIYVGIENFLTSVMEYSYLWGFVKDGKFMIFINQSNKSYDSYDEFFVKSSQSGIYLKDTIEDFDLVPIPETKDFYRLNINDSCGFILPNEIETKYVKFGTAFTQNGVLVDKYGNCVSSTYWAGFYEKKGDVEYSNADYYLLNIKFNDGGINENLYTSDTYSCGGSWGTNIANYKYVETLKKVGITSTGLDVLAPTKKTPFIDNQLVDSFGRVPFDGILLQKDEWEEFLTKYDAYYPILVIQDSVGRFLIYIRQEFRYTPGC